MSAKDISLMLAREAEHIAEMLLPNGKREGKEWRCGDVHGSAGKSLGISLQGNRAGVWKDFATNESGDLLDLWSLSKGLTIGEAIIEAKEYLGISDVQFSHQEKKYTKPTKPKCSKPMDDEMDYLQGERKLISEAIAAYKIAATDNQFVFPHIRDNELIALKYMNPKADKKNKWRWEKGCEPCLFGWQAIPERAREVVICEGHMDAPSWWQMGHPALSVPNGATALDWISVDYDYLERFDTIYLAFDNDQAGQGAIAQVADRLGRERCLIIDIPKPWKDGNDLVKSGFDCIKISPMFENARTLDPEELKHASHYHDKVIDLLTKEPADIVGYNMPWSKVGNRFRLRMGELTLLAGENFHGKSEGCGHITVDCLNQGARACVASLEYKPEKWIRNICFQAAAKRSEALTEDYAKQVVSWVQKNLWVFDVSGAKTKKIIDVFEYARKRYGIDLFVIDNLQKCGIGDDDYNAQKLFVEALTDFSKDHDVHVILVHHLNKSSDESPRNKSAVKGSGGITDMATNVVIWWRNRKKEKSIEEGVIEGEDLSDVLGKPDAMMIVEKQKEGGETPKILLWFDKNSRQFLGAKGVSPKQYVQYSSVKVVNE